MIDCIFFIVLVLNATGLFRFVAPQLGVSIGQVSLGLLMLNAYYLIAKARYSMPIFLRAGKGGWLFVFLFWPLLTLLYAPSFEIREIGLLLYYLTLFFGAAVYTVSNGLTAMYRVVFVSLILTVIGLVLSMIAPQYFEAVAALAHARVEEMGRPIGFSMQPNKLAINMGFLFIGWFSLWKYKNTLLEIVAILTFLLAMLVTGSRTGMLIAVIIVMLILTYSWRKRVRSSRYLLKISVLIACLAGGILGTSYYLSSIGDSMDRRSGDLLDRMESLLSFKLSKGGVLKDKSVRERLETQLVYISLIKDKPLHGHGFTADVFYNKNGTIFRSSHSTLLTCAMEYGVLYPFVFGLLMLCFYRKRSRCDAESVFGTNSIVQFILILLFLFVINGFLLNARTFYVVLGMFFAVVYCPRYVFSLDKNSGRISTCLNSSEISKRNTQSSRGQKTRRLPTHVRYEMAPRGVSCE